MRSLRDVISSTDNLHRIPLVCPYRCLCPEEIQAFSSAFLIVVVIIVNDIVNEHLYAMYKLLNNNKFRRKRVIPTGLEPVTYCLEGSCSIH